jgi:hypothetical protein
MAVTEVLEKANAALNALLSVIEDMPADSLTSPKTIGEWSVKDILAHITVWEEETAKAFVIWKIGVEPDWSHIKNLDEYNNATVKERRKQSLAKVVDQLKLVHNGVMDNVKSMSDADLKKRGGVPKWLVTQITIHINEHTEKVLAYKNTFQPKPEQTE